MATIVVAGDLIAAASLTDYENECDIPNSGTVISALAHLTELYPKLRMCVFNEQGRLRGTVALFLNGHVLSNEQLGQTLCEGDRLHLLPVLTCGSL